MKSNVSDHLELLHAVYIDACNKCSAEVSDLRDLMTIKSRVEKEGMSFLTITLPNFARDFERSLAVGYVDSTCFRMFRKHGAIPAFLQGMLSQIFDRETGRIYESTVQTPILVEAIRQVCLLFKKVEVACTPKREAAALDSFQEIERVNSVFSVPAELERSFSLVSDVLWGNMFHDFRVDTLLPRHGPGKTAERISGNQKYVWKFWHERLEPFFPFFGTAVSNSAAFDREMVLKDVTFLPPELETPVRVVLVPKTLKAPRVIAIEPVCMQYAQQAIQSYLYDAIESYWLTSGHVNFRDQSVNQKIALTSSRDGRYATIDLSDASDRVLHELAMRMFDRCPDLRDAIDVCRSTRATLPDGTLLAPLYKFASMGSALCFPVEAMYFYTICVVALMEKRELSLTQANLRKVTRDVYVYGDDIIVPTDEADVVLEYLHKYNCKVNANKTFVTGKFRESCGVDAYDGELVTPTYLRRLRPENKQQVAELISWVATANLFYFRGYWRTASLMYCTCEKILGSLPYVSPQSSALGRISILGYRSIERWKDSHPWPEIRAWVPSSVKRSDSLDGYSALQKSLLTLERKRRSAPLESESSGVDWLRWKTSEVDDDHLERSAPRGAVTLKRRWVPAT